MRATAATNRSIAVLNLQVTSTPPHLMKRMLAAMGWCTVAVYTICRGLWFAIYDPWHETVGLSSPTIYSFGIAPFLSGALGVVCICIALKTMCNNGSEPLAPD